MSAPDAWLAFPPQWLPFSPPLTLAMLAAYLRGQGRRVVVDDLNLAAYEDLLAPGNVEAVVAAVRRRLRRAERREAAPPREYRDWVIADLFGDRVMGRLPGALAALRRREFTDLEDLTDQYTLVAEALTVLAAGYPGYSLGLQHFRTPVSINDPRALMALVDDPEGLPFFPTLARAAGRIAAARPRLLGLSVISDTQLVAALVLARQVRRLAPEIHVTAGGAAVTYLADTLLAHPDLFGDLLDSVVVQEGELALARLLDALDGEAPLAEVPNLRFRPAGAGRFERSPRSDFVPGHELPLPDFSGLDPARYLAPRPSVCLLAYAKGCYWGKCTFCFETLWHVERFRPRPTARIVDDMEALADRWGVGHFDLVDLAIPPRFLSALGDEVAGRGRPLTWSAQSKAEESATPEAFERARRGGCVLLMVGVESASDRVLASMKKGATAASTRAYLTLGAAADIWMHAYIIVGFPGETPEEALETYRFIRAAVEAGVVRSVGPSPFTLCEHTPIHEAPERYGIRIDPLRDTSLNFEVAFSGDGAADPRWVERMVHRYEQEFDLPLNTAILAPLLLDHAPRSLVRGVLARLRGKEEPPGEEVVRAYRWNWLGGGDPGPVRFQGDPVAGRWQPLPAEAP